MAKNKIYIDVVVDDKGTTERVAVSAKKLGIALNESGKSGLEADRRLKGVAQASANGTKNFSKMSQGISSGLVPAYATLAAQVFAVSAAFQFLSSASNYKNLIESQEIYGAVTGTNFAAITKSLQEATSGQLKYQEAASATAIGSAAGLTATQLQGLAAAAKNSSVALGRDLTDSFNRLIRGTTKAEPELLDELGIILRLKPATEEYAASLGMAANDLNAFQRTQAVTNFVLEEADKKFGRLAEIMDEDAFVVAKFAKSFDDLVNELKVGVISVLNPALKFLTENTNALIASLALFALPITKSILPSLDEWADRSKKSARVANIAYIKSKKVLEEQRAEVEKLSDTQEKALKKADKLSRKTLKPEDTSTKTGRGALDFLSGSTDNKRAQAAAKKVLDAAEKNIDKSGLVTTGKLKGYNAEQVADLRKSFEIRTRIVDDQLKKQVRFHQKAHAQIKTGFYAVRAAGIGAFGAIQRAGVVAARGIDLAFKAASFIGIGFLLFDLGKEIYSFLFGTKESAGELNKELERTNARLEETSEFLTKINRTRAEGLVNLTEAATQTGRSLATIDIPLFIKEINQLNTLTKGSEGFNKLQKNITDTGAELVTLSPAFKGLMIEFEQTGTISDKSAKAFKVLDTTIRDYGQTIENLNQTQKDFKASLSSITQAVSVSPYDKLASSARDLERDAGKSLGGLYFQENELVKISEAKLSSLKQERDAAQETYNKVKRNLNGQARQAKANLDAVDAKIKAEEKSEITRKAAAAEEIADLTKTAVYAKRFREELEKRIGVIKENENAVLANNRALAETNRTDRSFANQRLIAEQSTINATNKVLDTQNKVLAASADVAAIKDKDKDLTSDAGKAAQRELNILIEQLGIAGLELKQAQQLSDEKITGIDLSEKLNSIEQKRLGVLAEITAAEQKIQLIKAGASQSAGKGSIASAQESRAAKEQLLQANINKLKGQEEAIVARISNEANKGAEADQAKLTQLTGQLQANRAAINLSQQNLDISKRGEEIALNALRSKTTDLQLQTKMFSFSGIQQKINDEILRQKNMGLAVDDAQIAVIEEQIKQQEGLNFLIDAQTRIRQGLTEGLTNGLDGLIQGTMTVKQAFANMGLSVLKIISRIISEMLVARLLLAAFGGTSVGSFIQSPIPEAGNLAMARNGGIMKGYSEGGIARGRNAGYPAILHGTEAVVPLPNGNSIPVEMRGGATSNNTIGININIDNQGNASSTQDQASQQNQAAELGKVVAGVVQEELHRQKRPGGILSRYGAA